MTGSGTFRTSRDVRPESGMRASQSGAELGYPVSEPLIIVGNGMAAALLFDELTRCAHGRHAIALIGDEPRLAYKRVLLSSVLVRNPHRRISSLSRCRGGAILPLRHRERHHSNFCRRSAPRIDEAIPHPN
jgi:hypothetical protein